MPTTPSNNNSIGTWVKQRRQHLRLKQAELAALVACSVVLIRKIEADQRRPSQHTAEQLALALQIPESEQAAFLHALHSGDSSQLSSPQTGILRVIES